MRSIDSAIALAEKLGKKLHVIWLLTSECNCKFQHLFIVPKKVNRLIQFRAIKPLGLFYKALHLYYSYFNHYNCLDQKRIEGLIDKMNDLEELTMRNRVFISTYSRFYPSSHPFRSFVPTKYLEEIINSYKEKNMIGVHIRRKDSIRSMTYSPLEGFIECMKEEIDKNNEVKFFVSTDDPQVEVQLRNIFHHRIVTHNKNSLIRNSHLAIQDAVIDLYCLANCSKLIGSYWSSFTDTAWQINGIEKVIIKSESLTNHFS
jgi:hypothetical protein